MTRLFTLLMLFTLSFASFASAQPSTPLTNSSATSTLHLPVLAQVPIEADKLAPDDFEAKFREMSTLGKIVYGLGVVVCVIGGIWLLVVGFQESIWWGIGMILCGIVSLVFIPMYWSKAKNPFFVQLVGIALMLVALFALS